MQTLNKTIMVECLEYYSLIGPCNGSGSTFSPKLKTSINSFLLENLEIRLYAPHLYEFFLLIDEVGVNAKPPIDS